MMTGSSRMKKASALVLNVLLLVAFIFPLLMIIVNSFKSRIDIVRNPLAPPVDWSFANYTEAYKTMGFGSAFVNSLIITVFAVALILIFSSSLAFFLVRWKWRINHIILLMLIASMIIPFQAIMIPFVSVFGSLDMLSSKWWLIYFYLGFGISLSTFMYHGFIKGVPVDMDEAALIDGAGRIKLFSSVIFPILKPITTTIAILNVLWIWNDFLLPSLVLISPEDRTLPLSTYYFFGKYTSNYGVAMAALVLSMIPIVIFYVAMQRQIIQGVVEGAVKS
ncbi:carbohydrate ABC transporter permease [Paenibacillus macerans]|uniref:carbohydrate ABC transporter permease n=2 Tax=Paenibacillus TaxID=44249 RepID=UPI00399D4BAF